MILFNPKSGNAGLSQTTQRKVLRLVVWLSSYTHTCIPVPGTDNVWADLLSRWTAPRILLRLVSVTMLLSSATDDFSWEAIGDLTASQQVHASGHSDDLHLTTDGLLCEKKGAVWIPDAETDPQLWLCVITYTGSSRLQPAPTKAIVL